LLAFEIFPNLKFARIRKIFSKLEKENLKNRKKGKTKTDRKPENQKKTEEKTKKRKTEEDGLQPARFPTLAGVNPPANEREIGFLAMPPACTWPPSALRIQSGPVRPRSGPTSLDVAATNPR
jgi:hypothetical protein